MYVFILHIDEYDESDYASAYSDMWLDGSGASRLVLTGVLYLLLDKKADLEEDSLMQTFSGYGSSETVYFGACR